MADGKKQCVVWEEQETIGIINIIKFSSDGWDLILLDNNYDARHQVQSPISMEETCDFNALNASTA